MITHLLFVHAVLLFLFLAGSALGWTEASLTLKTAWKDCNLILLLKKHMFIVVFLFLTQVPARDLFVICPQLNSWLL